MIEHVCCGMWFETEEEAREHIRANCPVILEAKRNYKPITVQVGAGGGAVTARTPSWESDGTEGVY